MNKSPEEVLASLNSAGGASLPQLILLKGEEAYYKDRLKKAITEKLFASVPAEDRSITVFSRDTDPEAVAAACSAGSLFGENSLVVIDDEKFLGVGIRQNEAGKKRLDALKEVLAERVDPNCTVLLLSSKLDGTSKLAKFIAAKGLVCPCEPLRTYKTAELDAWLERQAEQLGGRLSGGALRAIRLYLATVDVAPLAILAQELEKLSLYAGPRLWQEDDVEKVFAPLPEAGDFTLMRAVEEKDLPLALALLRQAEKDRVFIPQLCGQLLSSLRKLLLIKEGKAQGLSPKTIQEKSGIKPGVYFMAERNCRNYSLTALQKGIEAIGKVDLKLRQGGRTYDRLEEIIVALMKAR